MKIFNCAQGSPEWLELRLGVPTASEFGRIVKLNFDIRDGDTYRTFLYEKLAETLTGPLPSFGGRATDQGHFLEPEAVPFFEVQTDLEVKRVGFVVSDDGRCGCSPDGLIGDDAGLEIKCPGPVRHIQYLAENKLPSDYVAQVHGSLYVTGRKEWHFMSYHRRLPALHLVIKRDEEIMGKIHASMAKFHADFDALLNRFDRPKLKKAA